MTKNVLKDFSKYIFIIKSYEVFKLQIFGEHYTHYIRNKKNSIGFFKCGCSLTSLMINNNTINNKQ